MPPMKLDDAGVVGSQLIWPDDSAPSTFSLECPLAVSVKPDDARGPKLSESANSKSR
jgi:hypothetical protein